MYAVILAAGAGRRMGEFTSNKPRCLLNIGSETILQRQVRILKEVGVDPRKILVVTGYKAEMLEDCGCKTVNNPYYEYTDNAYSLGLALNELRDVVEPVLVLDGDLVFDSEAVLDLLNCKENNSVLIKAERGTNGSTGVKCDKDGYVCDVGKHISNSRLIYCSMMKICPEAVRELLPDLLQERNKRYWYTVIIANKLGALHVKAVTSNANIVGINTAYDYDIAKETFGIRSDKVCVTGAAGFLGRKICSIFERDHIVLGVGRKGSGDVQTLDISDYKKLEAFIELNQPNVIVHTAAIADPDTCDANREEAYAVNVGITKNLCKICADRKIKLVLISTDYVFDGESTQEYYPDSERRPKNYYGQTKVDAEELVKQVDNSLIIRIPVIYGYNDAHDKQTYVTKVISELTQEHAIYVDNEQIRYPVLIDDVACAIPQLLSERGVIQISSKQAVTKYQWAQAVADVFGLRKDLIHIRSEGDGSSPRPMHVKMNTDLADEKGIIVHDIYDGLWIMRKQMNCIFKLIYKSKSFEQIYGVTVGNFRYGMGSLLAEDVDRSIVEEADCVVPVPNSGLFYAMGLAERVNKPYLEALIKTDSVSRSFNIADIESRRRYLRHNIVPIKELLNGKRVILVDEAIFTGITLRTVCDSLKACGVKSIHICIPSPICSSRCKQQVWPNREVLSERIEAKDMANYFGVESVTHISRDAFVSRIKNLQDFFCYDCF